MMTLMKKQLCLQKSKDIIEILIPESLQNPTAHLFNKINTILTQLEICNGGPHGDSG
jgi:hypothetical protein